MAGAIGYRIDRAKGLFFDRAAVQSAVDRVKRKNLSRFGAFVRRTARSSIRKRKRGSSRPGQPPFSKTGLLRQFILFGYDAAAESVVIGPAKLNKPGSAPEVLEHGGVAEIIRVRVRKGNRSRERQRVLIKARPYMRPAFEAELKKAALVWKDTVR